MSFSFFFQCSGHLRVLHSFLHDALPISLSRPRLRSWLRVAGSSPTAPFRHRSRSPPSSSSGRRRRSEDTRLNSSHVEISYAVFCLKKKKKNSTSHITKEHSHVSSSNSFS